MVCAVTWAGDHGYRFISIDLQRSPAICSDLYAFVFPAAPYEVECTKTRAAAAQCPVAPDLRATARCRAVMGAGGLWRSLARVEVTA